MRLIVPLFFISVLLGCSASPSNPLPKYPKLAPRAATQILADRESAIHTISAQSALTLTRPDGQTIHLDSLIVIAPPDRLRLRAWKLNQAVFDLTVQGDGVWIEIPAPAPDKNDILSATLRTAKLARDLLLFSGGFFSSKGLQIPEPAGDSDTLVFARDADGGAAMQCDVDRQTLTVRQYRLIDSSGQTRFTIDMSDYRTFAGMIIWPTHLVASNLADHSRIEISLSDLKFNQELPPHALTPPPHAEKRP